MVIITPAIPNKMHSSTRRAAGDGTGGNTAANTAEVKKPKQAEANTYASVLWRLVGVLF